MLWFLVQSSQPSFVQHILKLQQIYAYGKFITLPYLCAASNSYKIETTILQSVSVCLTASFQSYFDHKYLILNMEEKIKKNLYQVSGLCKTEKIKQERKKKLNENSVTSF